MSLYQDPVKIDSVEAELGVKQLKERVFVHNMEHGWHQEKYDDTADNLSRWLRRNPERLSTRCNLTQLGLLVFIRFCDTNKGEGGLVSELHAKLGSPVSDW